MRGHGAWERTWKEEESESGRRRKGEKQGRGEGGGPTKFGIAMCFFVCEIVTENKRTIEGSDALVDRMGEKAKISAA